jgi:phosphoglycolate phosphatase
LQDSRTLIFDLDGTISNPSLGIFRCINHALTTHGFPEVGADSVAAQIGPPLDDIFKSFRPEADQSLISSLISAYRQRYAEAGFAENELYAGVPEALRLLADRGVRLGICTSKRRDFAEQILSMFELLSHFSFVDGGEIGVRKHQQLEGLLNSGAIDRQAVMIGDRDVDILAAKANGLRSVGVLWGFGDQGELSGAGADTIIREPGGLVKLGI